MTHLHPYLLSTLASIAITGLLSTAGSVAIADDHQGHQHEVIPAAKTVPGESIYQLEMPLTDQNGAQTSLTALRGKPALITMFYTTCQGVCPMLAFTLKRMEAELTPQERQKLRVAMVSFDPERDTPQALREFSKLQKLDSSRWLLARAPESSVRELAAVLGIRYRALPQGMFSHSAIIVLLDADGIIRARTERLQQPDPEFMQSLRKVLEAKMPSG